MASLRIINISCEDIQTIWSATEIGRFSLPSKNVQNSRLKKRSGLFAPGAKLVVREGNKTYTERVSSLLQETQKHRNTETQTRFDIILCKDGWCFHDINWKAIVGKLENPSKTIKAEKLLYCFRWSVKPRLCLIDATLAGDGRELHGGLAGCRRRRWRWILWRRRWWPGQARCTSTLWFTWPWFLIYEWPSCIEIICTDHVWSMRSLSGPKCEYLFLFVLTSIDAPIKGSGI